MDLYKAPVVSVVCIAFNHDKYIRNAIESFLLQKTSFPIEIIVHDDASSDSTAEIIKSYATKYNNLILPIFQEENQYSKGINPLFHYSLPKCQGKYIAICEGDDYWTDPNKLQKQVDFMELHPEYSLCFHNAEIKHEGVKGKDQLFCVKSQKETHDILDAIKGNGIATASMLFRAEALEIPEWLKYIYNGDYALHLLLANKGKIKYFNEVMSVYRKNQGGFNASVKNSEVWFKIYELLSYFDIYTNFKYHENILQRKESLRNKVKESISFERTRLLKLISPDFYFERIRYLLTK